jgi:hypothetical protein
VPEQLLPFLSIIFLTSSKKIRVQVFKIGHHSFFPDSSHIIIHNVRVISQPTHYNLSGVIRHTVVRGATVLYAFVIIIFYCHIITTYSESSSISVFKEVLGRRCGMVWTTQSTDEVWLWTRVQRSCRSTKPENLLTSRVTVNCPRKSLYCVVTYFNRDHQRLYLSRVSGKTVNSFKINLLFV